MKIAFGLTLGLILNFTGFAQPRSYPFGQLDSLQQIEARNVVVFIHTDWCKFCAAMEHTTLIKPEVVQLLNEKFYFISLDAEYNQEIVFLDKVFSYNARGSSGVNELAEALGTVDGKLSYPTLCILNRNYEIIFQFSSFLDVAEMLALLHAVSASPKD